MKGQPKSAVRGSVAERIRAHLRAAMVANGLSLPKTAALLDEDKGALSDCLSGKPKARAPSVYLVFRMLQKFDVDAKELFFDDPAREFFDPGIPQARGRKYTIKADEPALTPSGASREGANPEKRKGSGGGGAA